jgi:predicted cytidylate kinase
MIITIGGLAGSGTSTTSRILSEKTGIPSVSAGDKFRQMAAERGMDILEFSKFAEGNTEIDQEIDQRQAELARKADDLIVEGRLSAYFVEADLKVWCTAPWISVLRGSVKGKINPLTRPEKKSSPVNRVKPNDTGNSQYQHPQPGCL